MVEEVVPSGDLAEHLAYIGLLLFAGLKRKALAAGHSDEIGREAA